MKTTDTSCKNKDKGDFASSAPRLSRRCSHPPRLGRSPPELRPTEKTDINRAPSLIAPGQDTKEQCKNQAHCAGSHLGVYPPPSFPVDRRM
jgi:hypothetical protein